jgi:hypothetical protein
MPMLRTLSLATVAAATAGVATSQSLPFDVVQATSSLDVLTTFELRLPGTLIGDFDAVSNPAGTRTLPGLFGGSGNQPVTIQLDLIGTLDVTAPASGVFTLQPDVAAGTAAIDGLTLDLLTSGPTAGGGASAELTLRLTYETFRTFAPDSLFPSLIPLELPLGQASISDLSLVQSGPINGTLAATATAGVFDLAALVPASLSFLIDFNGQVTPVGPLPFVLPLVATVDLASCAASMAGTADAAVNQTLPAPVPFELNDLPFPLPTVLPPGGTANLLLSAALEEIVFDAALDLTLAADAPAAARIERYCSANPNSAGLGALLDSLGSTSIAANALRFDVAGLPANSFGFFLMSQVEDSLPGAGGSQGTMCITDPCFRFTTDVRFSGAGGAVSFQPDLTALPMGITVAPGESWRFQYWYRDANPQATSNLTDGLRVLFCE